MIHKAFNLIIALLLLSGCGKKGEKFHPSEEGITESVYASGRIKSKNQYSVYTTVSGIVEQKLLNEGDTVVKDTPILRIRNIASKFNAANAKIAEEIADFNLKGDKLNEQKVLLELALVKLKNDSLTYLRQKNLWSQQIGTQNEFDQRELAYKNSLANYKAAELRYSDLKRQLQFMAEQAKNNLEISSSQENDLLVKSETKGTLYSILKEVGEMVTPQTPVAVIGDSKNFIIEMDVDEFDIVKVRHGQKVLISLDSYKGKAFEAVVTKINTIMNERTRTFKIEAEFTVRPEIIYPNLTIEANIIIQSKEKALTIPRNCLVNDSMVMLSSGEMKKVKVGLMDYKKAEILSGISLSDELLQPQK